MPYDVSPAPLALPKATLTPRLDAFIKRSLPAVLKETSGSRMVSLIKKIVETDKWNTFSGFHQTTKTLTDAYEKAGALAEVYSTPTGGLQGNGRWIVQEACDTKITRAEVVAPFNKALADFKKNPWHAVQWSGSTQPGGVIAQVVCVDQESELSEKTIKRVKGKLVLTRIMPSKVLKALFEHGAVGIIFDLPVKENPDAVAWTKMGWGALPYTEAYARLPAVALSENAGNQLRAWVAKHADLKVRLNVEVRQYKGSHDLVMGRVLGQGDPHDEVWAVAHSSEPGALDNASGVAVCVEIARVLETLIKRGVLPRPKRTIRFLNAFECYGFFHYFENVKRLQPPLAGACIDIVGAKPQVCGKNLYWHGTAPGSAPFVEDLGETILAATLKRHRTGYNLVRKPFVSTEDTLLGDPQFGFPMPFITNHPYPQYHSSADTVDLLHKPGLEASAASMALYLYYLADAATPDALECAAQQTSKVVEQIEVLEDAGRANKLEWMQALQSENIRRLRRFYWGGSRTVVEKTEAMFSREIEDAILKTGGLAGEKIEFPEANDIPRRLAPLTPAPENTLPSIKQKLQESGFSSYSSYWADGRRTLGQIAKIISAQRANPIDPAKLVSYFNALKELGYVKIAKASEIQSRSALVEQLKQLGVKPGMDLMVHSSLSAVGALERGADTLIDALLEAIAPGGTLLMPSFNHFAVSVYNPLASPTTNGALPDAFWRRPGVVRSLQTSHAVAGLGPKAEFYCAGHLENGIWSAESPIGRLIEKGGYVLSLGVNHERSTAYHVGEISLNCGCLDQFGSRQFWVDEAGEVRETKGLAWRERECPLSPSKLDGLLEAAGMMVHGKVGQADSRLTKAMDIWSTRRAQLGDACKTCKIRPRPLTGDRFSTPVKL